MPDPAAPIRIRSLSSKPSSNVHANTPRACLVVDELDAFAERWGRTRAATFFTRTCPQLFDNGTIAYWRASRRTLGNAFVEQLTKMTQCVLEVGRHHLRVVKAEGRPASLQGQSVRLQLLDGTVKLREERALGRLGRGIERLRQERNLSQTDLARLAGVSASAISQAEAGRRGLSLDTVFVLCERLGIGIDDLLSSATPGYLVARHDRSGRDAPFVGLLDDPGAGLRAYLVRLGPGEAGTPPITHKGVELVLVASGLVRVDLGSETPVMRAGDARARRPRRSHRMAQPRPQSCGPILDTARLTSRTTSSTAPPGPRHALIPTATHAALSRRAARVWC